MEGASLVAVWPDPLNSRNEKELIVAIAVCMMTIFLLELHEGTVDVS